MLPCSSLGMPKEAARPCGALNCCGHGQHLGGMTAASERILGTKPQHLRISGNFSTKFGTGGAGGTQELFLGAGIPRERFLYFLLTLATLVGTLFRGTKKSGGPADWVSPLPWTKAAAETTGLREGQGSGGLGTVGQGTSSTLSPGLPHSILRIQPTENKWLENVGVRGAPGLVAQRWGRG